MYTLYYMPGTCSMAVHVVLNELAQPVKLENVRLADGKTDPGYLNVNPRGSVPALLEGDTLILEGGAILTYLLDKHESPMLPKSGIKRAKALEWLMFANATMHPAYARIFFLQKTLSDEAAKAEGIKASVAKINQLWADVDLALSHSTYLCGEECSAADILLTVIANWGQTSFGKDIVFGDNVKRMIRAVIDRPSYRKALLLEKVEYKAAA